MTIWNILWMFGIFYDHWMQFFRFWYHVPRKIWQPCSQVLLLILVEITDFSRGAKKKSGYTYFYFSRRTIHPAALHLPKVQNQFQINVPPFYFEPFEL
jgi:hypothetical protein